MFFSDSRMRESSGFFDAVVTDLATAFDDVRAVASPDLNLHIARKRLQLERLKLVNVSHDLIKILPREEFADNIPVAIQYPQRGLVLMGDYKALDPLQRVKAAQQLSMLGVEYGMNSHDAEELISNTEDARGLMIGTFEPMQTNQVGYTGSIGSFFHLEHGLRRSPKYHMSSRPIVSLLRDNTITDQHITLFHELVHVDQQTALPVCLASEFKSDGTHDQREQEARQVGAMLVQALLDAGKTITHGLSQLD